MQGAATQQAKLSKTKHNIPTPYVGTKDYVFEDFAILDYIFSTWKYVLSKFGYDQYILPLVEDVSLFTKSGDELAQKELYNFTDKSGRHIAIRPEATPGVARMVASFYKKVRKPIRLFSILNFMRYERPQAGRLREFWQLNVDMMGKDSALADAEIIGILMQIMNAFGVDKTEYKILVNSRPLMDSIISLVLPKELQHKKAELYRIIDKYTKLNTKELSELLHTLGLNSQLVDFFLSLRDINLTELYDRVLKIVHIGDSGDNKVTGSDLSLTAASEAVSSTSLFEQLKHHIDRLQAVFDLLGNPENIRFAAYIIRGLDYYDGIVFEVFDATGKIKRALAGGGRYNSLGKMFGIDLPAVGFGMGNVTLAAFLKERGKLDFLNNKYSGADTVYYAILTPQAYPVLLELAYNIEDLMRRALKKMKQEATDQVSIKVYKILNSNKSSAENKKAMTTLPCGGRFKAYLGAQVERVSQALRSANKVGAKYIVLLGEDELKEGKVTVRLLS